MVERWSVPIGGRWLAPATGRTIRAPYGGEPLAVVPECSAADVDAAVEAARATLRTAPLPPWRRVEVLDRAAEQLQHRSEEFARTIALEAAKPIRTARTEVQRAISTFRFSAAEARKLAGEVVPLDAAQSGDGKIGFTLRVPIGVVAAISPFNFPLNLVAHKVAPAIAAGCPVVLKPAAQTPLSAIKLAEVLLGEAGLPAGFLSVVTGPGSAVGARLVENDDVAFISFTGSPEVGWGIRARAPKKRVGLELGNNAPVIVEPDSDWESAVLRIRTAGFSHAGQSCISTQRVFVHDSIADAFEGMLTSEVATLALGDPLDERTEVSTLISDGERVRVTEWVDEAVRSGARVTTGGSTREDRVLEPTVIVDATPDMKVCRKEVFGPVVALQRYTELEQAFELANDTAYGLQASIFTPRLDVALRAAQVLDFGCVLVNEVPTWRVDQQPYGGVRDSGNTREGPAYAIREMTESRLVVLG
jgi:acyl-CoA reductase-like NAD-dependent aldehyde dehydrogenase